MADRFWEHNIPRRHVYLDDTTGRILGNIKQTNSDREFVAWAYDNNVGSYTELAKAQHAVEVGCVDVETRRAAMLAAQTQADGAEA